MTEVELKSSLRRVLILHIGREKAIDAGSLAGMFGFRDDRPVRKAIEELIKEHFPVCSATEEPPGYFFPASTEEARRYTRSLQKRAVRIFLRRRHIIRDTARYYENARQEMMV